MKRYALLLTILGQLALGKDYFWQPNSNWNNPANWELGRVPCGQDTASFASVPDNSVIYLDSDVVLQSIILPENGQIILGSNVALTLSEDAQCGNGMGGEQGTEPAPSNNAFIGAATHYWECSENWITEDMFPAKHPPCGDDRAIFEEESYFYFVKANETISVSSLQVRGTQIESLDDLDKSEFQLDIMIKPECATNPSSCPCPSDAGCMTRATTSGPAITVPLTAGGALAGTVIGVILALIIIAAIVIILLVIFILMYRKKKQSGSYKREDLVEETVHNEMTYEEPSVPKTGTLPSVDSRSFDNPVYESTTLTSSDVPLTGYQEKPKLDFNPSDPSLTPDVNNYEVLDDAATPSSDNDFVKVDLGALAEVVNAPPEVDAYEPQNEHILQPTEGNKEEKKKKGKKPPGKYERL